MAVFPWFLLIKKHPEWVPKKWKIAGEQRV